MEKRRRKYRTELVLDSLEISPWQTARELSVVLGYRAGDTLKRLIEQGKLERRVSERAWNCYIYALAGQSAADKEKEPLKESQVQKEIRLALGGHDCVLWRNETGATVQVTLADIQDLLDHVSEPAYLRAALNSLKARGLLSYGLCKGSSDLIGLMRGAGQFVAIEVKRPGGARREEQKNFIELVRSLGGRAGFAESVEEARRIIT